MKIVEKKSDNSIVMVADCPTSQYSPTDYNIYDIPGWDWSLANLSGVDTSKTDFINQLKWTGTTLVKK